MLIKPFSNLGTSNEKHFEFYQSLLIKLYSSNPSVNNTIKCISVLWNSCAKTELFFDYINNNLFQLTAFILSGLEKITCNISKSNILHSLSKMWLGLSTLNKQITIDSEDKAKVIVQLIHYLAESIRSTSFNDSFSLTDIFNCFNSLIVTSFIESVKQIIFPIIATGLFTNLNSVDLSCIKSVRVNT